MKNLHLMMDHNFVETPRNQFERYYPGENKYVIHTTNIPATAKKHPGDFEILNLRLPESQKRIIDMARAEGVERILLHGLNRCQTEIVTALRQNPGVKVYWIFWGYDMYETLAYEKGYKLIDEPFNPLRHDSYQKPYPILKWARKLRGTYYPDGYKRLMTMVDYFCFWNKFDYELLRRNFDLPIKYKMYAYGASERGDQNIFRHEPRERETKCVMINHQASIFGNHTTIFKRLSEIDKDNELVKIAPISYGLPVQQQRIKREGEKYFGDKFKPVTEYLPRDKYFELIDNADVAIFGQKRQEASGNIIQLLRNGTKVFLRNDNNLLQYYRSKGYIIFSFEDDLKDMSSLRALTVEEQQHNRDCALRTRLYNDTFMPQLFDE